MYTKSAQRTTYIYLAYVMCLLKGNLRYGESVSIKYNNSQVFCSSICDYYECECRVMFLKSYHIKGKGDATQKT